MFDIRGTVDRVNDDKEKNLTALEQEACDAMQRAIDLMKQKDSARHALRRRLYREWVTTPFTERAPTPPVVMADGRILY